MSSDSPLDVAPESLVVKAYDLWQEAKARIEKMNKINLACKLLLLSNLKDMYEIVRQLSRPQEDLQARYEIIVAENKALGEQVNEYKEEKDKIQEKFDLKFNTTPLPPEWIDSLVNKLDEHVNTVAKLKKETEELIENYNKQNQDRATNSGRTYFALVSSLLADVTGNDLIVTIRRAVDAKNTRIKIEKLKKVRNDSVIVGCNSIEVLEKAKERILAADQNVEIEDLKGRDPLVILRNVMAFYTDQDITDAIVFQSHDMSWEIPPEDFRCSVKFRKNTSEDDKKHVVIRVSPKVWQRLIKAGVVQIDVQCVVVDDYSPLIQCTQCLIFGHTRGHCRNMETRCSHCGGIHTRESCIHRINGGKPRCRNCIDTFLFRSEHNAFDHNCPVRKAWDMMARSSVAYE